MGHPVCMYVICIHACMHIQISFNGLVYDSVAENTGMVLIVSWLALDSKFVRQSAQIALIV